MLYPHRRYNHVKKYSLNMAEALVAEVDVEVLIADGEETRSSFIRNAIRAEIDRRREERKA